MKRQIRLLELVNEWMDLSIKAEELKKKTDNGDASNETLMEVIRLTEGLLRLSIALEEFKKGTTNVDEGFDSLQGRAN